MQRSARGAGWALAGIVRNERLACSRLGERWRLARSKLTTRGCAIMPWRKATTGLFTKARLAAKTFAVTAWSKTTIFASTAKPTRRRPTVITRATLYTLAVIEATTKPTATRSTTKAATVSTARRCAKLAVTTATAIATTVRIIGRRAVSRR